MKSEERGIGPRLYEANGASVCSKTVKPGVRSLFETVERLEKATYMSGPRGINEARGLLTVNLLIESAMEEGILDVKPVSIPIKGERDGEDDAHCRRFDNRDERDPWRSSSSPLGAATIYRLDAKCSWERVRLEAMT